MLVVVAVKQRYKLKSNSQQQSFCSIDSEVVAVKQRYKLKSNSQLYNGVKFVAIGCCCKAKIQT